MDSTGDHLRAADFVSLAQGAGAGETASSRAEEELDGWDEGSADPSELAEAGLASETLARLYEEQGHVDAAVAIRRGLVVPDDWTVVVLGESGLDWEGVKIKPTREGILCRWTVGPARLAGGKAVHDDAPPSDLQLVLRLASTNLDGTRYWDLEPVRESGFCVLKPEGARDGTHVIAAVGLKSPSGRFLPLVHTRPLPLPDSVRRSGR